MGQDDEGGRGLSQPGQLQPCFAVPYHILAGKPNTYTYTYIQQLGSRIFFVSVKFNRESAD